MSWYMLENTLTSWQQASCHYQGDPSPRVRKNILSAWPRQVKIVQDKQSPGDDYPTDKLISQLLYDPQKSMTYQTTLGFHEKAISGLLLGIWTILQP